MSPLQSGQARKERLLAELVRVLAFTEGGR